MSGQYTVMVECGTDHSGRRAQGPLPSRADEIQHQVGDSVWLVELQEVSGTVDDAHVAVVGKRVGYPTGESRCHATVVASVKVQARQLRPRHPVAMQVAVRRGRRVVRIVARYGPSAARQLSGVPIAASTCRRSALAS